MIPFLFFTKFQIDYLLKKAEKAILSKKFQEYIAILEKLDNRKNFNDNQGKKLQRLKGDFFFLIGQYEEAINHYKASEATCQKIILNTAKSYYRLHRYTDSLKLLDRSLNTPETSVLKVQCYSKLNEFVKSKGLIDQFLSMNKNPDLFIEKAYLEIEKGKKINARNSIEKALICIKDNYDCNLNKYVKQIGEDRFERLTNRSNTVELKELIEKIRNFDIVKGLINRGLFFFANEEFDNVIIVLEKASQIEDKNFRIFLILGLSYLKKDEVSKANIYLSKAKNLGYLKAQDIIHDTRRIGLLKMMFEQCRIE